MGMMGVGTWGTSPVRKIYVIVTKMANLLSPASVGGRRTRRKVHAGLKAKTLKRMLKAKGKKTTGKKATLLKRLKE